MQTPRLIGLAVAAIMGGATCAMFAPAGEPGTPNRLMGGFTVFSFSAPPNGFIGGQTVRDGNDLTVACYGILKVANQSRFTYLILFKSDPKKHKGGGVGVEDLPGKGDNGRKGFFGTDPIETSLPLWVACGDTKFEFTYNLKTDQKTKAILSESLKIGAKEYVKDLPRLFLVDLTQEKHTCLPIQGVQPQPVPDVDGGLEKIEQAIRQLKEKTPEVKEFFEGKAKKQVRGQPVKIPKFVYDPVGLGRQGWQDFSMVLFAK